ncbi:MAG TPA: VCBS repeat-containing protein [Solirubrobacterales bacterium]|nr:VCBS repeat-containing protein [Solirubrobacterales bacterium]
MSAHIEADESSDPQGAAAVGGFYSLPTEENAPVCATTGHRIKVVRTYMEGSGYRADEEDAYISSIVRRMNWKFLQQSQLSSDGNRSLEMKVDCKTDGSIDVHDIEIPLNYNANGVDTTDGSADVIETIVYVGIVMGVPSADQAIKHLIFDTREIRGFVGIGFKFRDPDKTASDVPPEWSPPEDPTVNNNRVFTTDAFIARNPNHTLDGRSSWESVIPIHELLHVMGASFTAGEGDPQTWASAPYADTGSHCIDGIDILCYASGTSREGSYSETRCPESAGYGSPLGVALDCQFDTYFDAKSESGEWLDRFWNIGGSENPFLVEEGPGEGMEDDVDGDGRSDLITVDLDGTAHVFRGTANGIEATASADSLTEQVDPALHDGVGHYLIDTADVTGEGRADLITMGSAGGVYVHKGMVTGGFGTAGAVQLTSLKPIMNGRGTFEPTAVADVNGDGYGDLVGLDGSTLTVFKGQRDGTFSAAINAQYTIDPALIDGVGSYPFDVVDVSGDGRADFVYMSLGSVVILDGNADATFGNPRSTPTNSSVDDGRGEEPIGLGDVNADGHADLVTLDGTTLKLRTANTSGGEVFNSPTTAYAGSIDSSLLDGRGEELVGLFDYDRDRRADLVSVNDDGRVLTYAAQSGGTFASPVNQGGSIQPA